MSLLSLSVVYIIGYIVMFSVFILEDYNQAKKHFHEHECFGYFRYNESDITLEDYVRYATLSIFWILVLPILILRYLFKEYVKFLINMYRLIDDD